MTEGRINPEAMLHELARVELLGDRHLQLCELLCGWGLEPCETLTRALENICSLGSLEQPTAPGGRAPSGFGAVLLQRLQGKATQRAVDESLLSQQIHVDALARAERRRELAVQALRLALEQLRLCEKELETALAFMQPERLRVELSSAPAALVNIVEGELAPALQQNTRLVLEHLRLGERTLQRELAEQAVGRAALTQQRQLMNAARLAVARAGTSS